MCVINVVSAQLRACASVYVRVCAVVRKTELFKDSVKTTGGWSEGKRLLVPPPATTKEPKRFSFVEQKKVEHVSQY